MILRPFASGCGAATIHSMRSTPSGSAEENGRERPQKGDYNGQMSFALASKDNAQGAHELFSMLKLDCSKFMEDED